MVQRGVRPAFTTIADRGATYVMEFCACTLTAVLSCLIDRMCGTG
jgi:hypothetical protein